MWEDYKLGDRRREEHERRWAVEKVVQCPCGSAIRAEDEDKLLVFANYAYGQR
jgi:hypothetical protein